MASLPFANAGGSSISQSKHSPPFFLPRRQCKAVEGLSSLHIRFYNFSILLLVKIETCLMALQKVNLKFQAVKTNDNRTLLFPKQKSLSWLKPFLFPDIHITAFNNSRRIETLF